jgi:hypothetical protein
MSFAKRVRLSMRQSIPGNGEEFKAKELALGTPMAAKGRMETLTSRVVMPSPQDWLDNCAFTPRHHALARRAEAPILTQNFENKLPTKVQAARERVIFPIIDRALAPLTSPVAPAREIQTLPDFPPTSASTKTKNPPPLPKKIAQLPAPIVAELHSFRQLSSPLFCPETSMDTLPEYILFGLIVLLAVAWPILAMLGVMSHS